MLGFGPLSDAPLGSAESVVVDAIVETLPAKTLSADDGIGVGANTLPVKTLFALPPGGVLALDLPLKTLEADEGNLARGDATLPMLLGDGTGGTGVIGDADSELPAKTLYAFGDQGVAETLPLKELSASGLVGRIGTVDVLLPMLELDAAGQVPSIQHGAATLPALTLEADGFVELLSDAALELPALLVTASGETGQVGALDATLPVFELDAQGYGEYTATAALLLPMLLLDAQGQAAIPETFRTWVLNLHNKALTEYTQWGFNSFARFRGVTLAASAGGVVVLADQDQDDDQPIVAQVRSGVYDYDNMMLKRMEYAYAGIRADSDLYLRLLTKESGTQTYILRGGGANLESRRVVLARGVRSRYWQWELANRSDGNDFELKHLALYPSSTIRRVHGGSP